MHGRRQQHAPGLLRAGRRHDPEPRSAAAATKRFEHHELDVRDRDGVDAPVADIRPDLVVHCAAQPSHDLAARRPFDDFDVNAVGTLNLLEAARASCPESPFVFLSTNKVYGDAPNELELVELETRYDYADPALREGIDESCRIDATLHSLFGASKAAADLLVQEYGRYFGMPTVCFRGGCLTGSNHASAELHGFLAYLARCVREGRTYRIYGYKGKQVRDNIHASDVCAAALAFADAAAARRRLQHRRRPRELDLDPRGDRAASRSSTGSKLDVEYVDEPRRGDHICYISDLRRLQRRLPGVGRHASRSTTSSASSSRPPQ